MFHYSKLIVRASLDYVVTYKVKSSDPGFVKRRGQVSKLVKRGVDWLIQPQKAPK